MPDEYVSNWDFTNKHIDESIGKDNFLSAARCIIYAAPYQSAKKGTADFHRIGVSQGYNWAEQRQVEMIFELGSDIPYLVPGRTTGQISLSRILLFGKDLTNLIYYGDNETPADGKFIKSIKEISVPFDLMFAAYDNSAKQKVYSRVFTGAWLNSRNESISAGQVVLAENLSIMYEDIVSVTIPTT